MAGTRRGSFRGHPSYRRRQPAWEAGVGQTGVQNQISASTAVIGAAAVQPTTDGLTLIRTRGRLQMFLSAATAALDGFTGAVGIGLATAAAVTAGAASVPTPIGEQDWDGWLWWQAIQLKCADPLDANLSVDKDAVSGNIAYMNIDIDSKAMRKLGLQDSLYLSLEVAEVGTAILNWSFDTRMLFKLP